MFIIIKTPEEIALLREGGKHLARIVRAVAERVVVGISTKSLDEYAHKLISDYGDTPAFLNYKPDGAPHPFPSTACISINEEVVHGIPNENHIIADGDIVTIDIGLNHSGCFTDHAITVIAGTTSSPEAKKLVEDTQIALMRGIEAIHSGSTVGDIGYAIQTFVEGSGPPLVVGEVVPSDGTGGVRMGQRGYGIVRGYAGHGVGRYIHEDPFIMNEGKKGSGPKLVPGMVIAIEPMLTLGTHKTKVLSDGYTVVTTDKSLSAHFEHTVLITENGYEILTKE
ncbi:hypothetical protein A2997_01800 [Candidatus Nomurabacteria bacterium RIFCSPLOWO2_01_FULL_36_10b]|uniref:Methionine aminopeptidase n=1 Tax=Candidatus Nomurabacteria bacterium RIFCSPLOWO2_01_FULL_36_10b TaxID=1801766 RepID=A0A1F6WNJ7_9BACT|nr:MAG: hypothetical protein A2997_01800 [Candidatus Nomurabacteria bacterium RIFCSPLOWO2_01_FULL_36_10b]